MYIVIVTYLKVELSKHVILESNNPDHYKLHLQGTKQRPREFVK